MGEVHFDHGEKERQRQLRTLILVHAVAEQTVLAAAGLRVVKWQAEVVVAQEPGLGAARLR